MYDLYIGDGCHLQLAPTATVTRPGIDGQSGLYIFNQLHIMAGGEVSPVSEAGDMDKNITLQVDLA